MSGLDDGELRALLGERDKAELVDWVMQQSAGMGELRRAIVSFVAPHAGTRALVSELSAAISKAWGRIRTSREPWKLARPIAAELDPVLTSLNKLMERGDMESAEKVLRRFVEAADKGFEHIDDSYGYLGPVCQDGVALWGKAWSKIERRDPTKLSKLVYDGVRENGYAIRDHMIRDFAAALGREGLLALKEMFTAEHKANLTKKTLEDWKQREPLRHLADVADALGDVDMYIDVQREGGTEDAYAMPIARRLLEAGRGNEALIYLNRADPNRSHFNGEPDDYMSLRCKILKALGRDEDVRSTLWQEFHRGLNAAAFEKLVAMTIKENRQGVMDEAIAAAEGHVDRLAAAMFLAEKGEIKRAAAIVDAHTDKFSGRFYGTLLNLAELLQSGFPASAWSLYRALLLEILREKRAKAYHHAADYLRLARDLAARAGLQKQHQELMTLLRQQHGRKYGFWRLVKD